jgi:uncharacterized membrane protein
MVVVSSGADAGRTYVLDTDEVTLGRADSSGIRFDDPTVSRMHAVLRRDGRAVYLDDLGSSAGTLLNGVRLTGPRRLRTGDVIALAGVLLRFDDQSSASATQPMAAQVRYDIGRQEAGVINNVARDQYLIQQRESFLRAVAGTRTKARFLIAVSFVLYAVGFALFAYGILSFMMEIPEWDGSGDMPSPFTQKIFGVPSAMLGFAMCAVGSFMLIAGTVLHVVATARRKRVEIEYPGWTP